VDVLHRKCHFLIYPQLLTEAEQGKEEGQRLSSSSQPWGQQVTIEEFLKIVSLSASELLRKNN